MEYDSEGGRFPPTIEELRAAIYRAQCEVDNLQAGGYDCRRERGWLGAMRGHLKRMERRR